MPPFFNPSLYFFQILWRSIRTFGFASQGNVDRKIQPLIALDVFLTAANDASPGKISSGRAA
jgi:hypothetical protein